MSGLPLLSGLPPTSNDSPEDVACRKCNKEFNFLFTRPRRCNHCGYTYCHNCTDYQALMPRYSGPGDSGYDPMNVCAFCIEFLQITAAGRGQLKTIPLSKLKKYAGAYNIPIGGAVEKDDLINTLFSIRGGNGCLPPANEAFYREYSVPNRSSSRPRGLFSSRSEPPPNLPPRPARPSRSEFARPDLEPQPSPNYETRPNNTPSRNTNHNYAHAHAPPSGGNYHYHHHFHNHYTPPTPPQTQYPTYTRPQSTPPRPPPSSSRPPPTTSSRPPPPPPTSRPTPPSSAPPPPPPPPPSLDELLNMSERDISSLPISSLKQILFVNHVNATNTMILEKSDLVKRVVELVESERRDREERQEREREEREEEERMIREAREREDSERRARQEAERRSTEHERANATTTRTDQRARVEDVPEDDESLRSSASTPQEEIDILPPAPDQETRTPTPPPPISTLAETSPAANPPARTAKAHERHTGLCVICQDEDANIAIVDCGHMAMCRGCSELVMSSSRECPLCRTRIVTEARLLRIFKT